MVIHFNNFENIFDRLSSEEILADYRTAYQSRQMSLIGRQEVLSGRAKFGIFGAGKEVPQVALARYFCRGDFRSGYYRDQTLMLALGTLTIRAFFAQLYAHADLKFEPASGGRMMNAHYVTQSMNEAGEWNPLTEQFNTSADVSPTASQMPRLVGLAQASKLYREVEELQPLTQFSVNGEEIAFGTIGNASTAEGMFWESLNAIGVLQVPAVISIWDDNYGISVANEHQITKDLSDLLDGFQRDEKSRGYDVYRVPAWSYDRLTAVYESATRIARREHIPAIIHVIDVTQPQGHSTSGSHERYKTKEQLQREQDLDCLVHFREFILENNIISADELVALEKADKKFVRREQKAAWQEFVESIRSEQHEVQAIIADIAEQSTHADTLIRINQAMMKPTLPKRKDIMEAIFLALKTTREEDIFARWELMDWRDDHKKFYQDLYSTDLLDDNLISTAVAPIYGENPPMKSGFEILNRFFDTMFERDPRIVAFGEDVGFLGGVNQSMAGMQAKYGALRVSDTGIRETTIIGQAIGLAMRGLRPIAEIQYLDYVLYALQIMSDDLATLRWRTKGGQIAPAIIRTRGHRLEGVWHSGSPMAGIINLIRGIHVLVPRNMVQAVGFYNTLLQGNDPGLIVEVLNSYRKKEQVPENLADITIPLGVPETLREGTDITLVTYGALCEIALEATQHLQEVGISVEVIDVQSLLPFDIHGHILESLKKTNRILFVDEDVPGGTTAYMLQEVLEKQGGYHWLDSEPRTLSAKEHRPAYGSDGGYFSKPNIQTIFEAVYEIMNEFDPAQYPLFYRNTST